MTSNRPISAVILPFILCLLAPIGVAVAAPQSNNCELPKDLQREIAAKYPRAEVVTLSALDEEDGAAFQRDHKDVCPGLTEIDFYGDRSPTIGLVLVATDDARKNAKLVVAHQVAGHWRTTVLETADGARTPVVWNLPPGHYTDVYGRKNIEAKSPVIVFAGFDSWSILYAWTGRRVTKIWLQD